MICPVEPCNWTETCGENVQRGPAGMVELRGLLDSTEKRGKKTQKTDTTFTLYRWKNYNSTHIVMGYLGKQMTDQCFS